MRCIACHTIAMLVVAFRSTASAVEQEAPVREGVVGETVGFPTLLVFNLNTKRKIETIEVHRDAAVVDQLDV
jgi:hypothetical protein